MHLEPINTATDLAELTIKLINIEGHEDVLDDGQLLDLLSDIATTVVKPTSPYTKARDVEALLLTYETVI